MVREAMRDLHDPSASPLSAWSRATAPKCDVELAQQQKLKQEEEEEEGAVVLTLRKKMSAACMQG